MTGIALPAINARLWLRLAILCGVALWFAASATASEERSLILQSGKSNRPYTSVSINGTTTIALVDTGATISLIQKSFLAHDPVDFAGLEQALILGLGGQRQYPITSLNSLQAGTETWSDVRVAVNLKETFPVDVSVLPIGIFDSRVVDFDFKNQRLHLYDTHPKRVRHGQTSSIRYQTINNLMFMPVEINGARGMALIDTGADVSFVNQTYADRARGRIDEVRTQIVRGSDLNRIWASIHEFRRMEFGNHTVDKLTIPVVSTDLFRELGFEDEPMMVIGMDLLSNFRLQIDRKRSRAVFVSDMSPGARFYRSDLRDRFRP